VAFIEIEFKPRKKERFMNIEGNMTPSFHLNARVFQASSSAFNCFHRPSTSRTLSAKWDPYFQETLPLCTHKEISLTIIQMAQWRQRRCFFFNFSTLQKTILTAYFPIQHSSRRTIGLYL
jgi:hypothetical protein